VAEGIQEAEPMRHAVFVITSIAVFSMGLSVGAKAGCQVAAQAAPLAAGPLTWHATETRAAPVMGSDGLIHIAYSTIITNMTSAPATGISLRVIDPATGKDTGHDAVVGQAGQTVTGRLTQISAPMKNGEAQFADRLGAGQSGTTYMDLTFKDAAEIPCDIALQIANSETIHGKRYEFNVTGPSLPVTTEAAIVLAPPLTGDGWLDGDGCCHVVGAHRWVLNPIDGTAWPAEQFAIDFVQRDTEGRLFHGDMSVLKNWQGYGAPILAAHSGTVVQVVNTLPNQVPGKPLPPASIETAAGNSVIIDMGDRHYALYAHMIPGSITVHTGDVVHQGQRIGALGNSGNSDAPHLHFQVMDSPSSLKAVGLPFVFDKMELQGRTVGVMDSMIAQAMTGRSVAIKKQDHVSLSKTMPLTFDVVGFD
jgi:hypothetical protein